MGNFCCENKNIDEGNFRSEKYQINSPIMIHEKNSPNKIINCETKINHKSLPNLSEQNQANNNSSINNTNNYYESNYTNNIPLNPPLIPNKTVTENIINSSKKLKLIILQSKYLPEGKEYIINAGGLIGSKRNAKDGVTYFGDISVSIKIYY